MWTLDAFTGHIWEAYAPPPKPVGAVETQAMARVGQLQEGSYEEETLDMLHIPGV